MDIRVTFHAKKVHAGSTEATWTLEEEQEEHMRTEGRCKPAVTIRNKHSQALPSVLPAVPSGGIREAVQQ